MNNDVKTLIDFLGRFDPEVCGREAAQPDASAIELLERFARGECEEDERRKACEMLRLQPSWLRWLATHVRLARTASEAQA